MLVDEEASLHAGEEMTPRGRLVGKEGFPSICKD